METFTNALSSNKSLVKLSFGHLSDDSCWGALACLLCDKTSIERTFDSNHTLEEAVHNVDESIPGDVLSSLAAVSRQKILLHHFPPGTDNVSEFNGMAMNVLPRAIEWIGRDDRGFILMYHLVRGIPALFEQITDPNQ